jgi:ribosomal-protein-alanine N-acetyltransferase
MSILRIHQTAAALVLSADNMSEARGFPSLDSERLVLRELTLDDADVVFPHFANEEVVRYEDAKPAANIKDVTEIIEWGRNLASNKTGILWGIFRKGDGAFLGQINYVVRPDNNFIGSKHRAEIGYDLTPPYWGNGYMSEAINCAIEFIFDSTQINRIEAIVHAQNKRSLDVLSRLGFRREGILREYVQWDGEYWDMALLAMLKRDWIEVKGHHFHT